MLPGAVDEFADYDIRFVFPTPNMPTVTTTNNYKFTDLCTVLHDRDDVAHEAGVKQWTN